MSEGGASPLQRLAEAAGRDFPHLFEARDRTRTGLTERRDSLSRLAHSPGASVVLMGSWGRAEVTARSDDDFMVLVHGQAAEAEPSVASVSEVLRHAPGTQGPFAHQVLSGNLIHNIGLNPDDNKNLTRRMLFLLESTPVSGEAVYGAVREEILGRYLDASIKPYRPPRFLLNDVVRYWRTICVDFAGKEWEGSESKWGIRNAKLRTYRKILYAGGLLPTLECFRFDGSAMPGFVKQQLEMPSTDRIASAFLENGASDEGARALAAYDEFIGLMNDSGFREALQAVTRENADRAESFARVRRIGQDIQAGLLALLYEASPRLSKVVRDYAIF